MQSARPLDPFGVTALIAFSLLLAVNQVVIKVTVDGFQPVFLAGLRSAGAILCIAAWMAWRGIALDLRFPVWGVAIGLAFAAEFIFLFLALDLTTVGRSSVIFYTMPVWLAVAGHVLLPGERLTARRSAGLALAVTGVAVAVLGRGTETAGSLAGDLLALAGALGWAGLALMARASPLRAVRPEMQMLWQVVVSAPVLLALSPAFGPLLRDLAAIHLWGLAFQTVVVVSAGFIFWLWLLSLYSPPAVASFSFLSPVFGVALGWLVLAEDVGPELILALVLVAAGLVLITRRGRAVAG